MNGPGVDHLSAAGSEDQGHADIQPHAVWLERDGVVGLVPDNARRDVPALIGSQGASTRRRCVRARGAPLATGTRSPGRRSSQRRFFFPLIARPSVVRGDAVDGVVEPQCKRGSLHAVAPSGLKPSRVALRSLRPFPKVPDEGASCCAPGGD